MFYADYADNCVFCVMYLRNVADYAEIQVFTHFYAIKSITQYSGGGVITPPPEYCVMTANFCEKCGFRICYAI